MSLQSQCINYAFNLGTEEEGRNIEAKFNINADFPFPEVCLTIIGKTYGKRANSLHFVFLKKLVSDMMQTHTDSENFEEEINEAVTEWLNNFKEII